MIAQFYIKNMYCNCCIKLLSLLLSAENISIKKIKMGFLEVDFNQKNISRQFVENIIIENGFEILQDKEKIKVTEIKQAVIELVHDLNNVNSIIRKSDYLIDKLGMTYQQISKLFSKHEPITLERYIILNKIEKIKFLIDSDDYTLTEIAYIMDYSSVQYLSNQFKKEVKLSVSEYKNSTDKPIKSLDKLY